jgi:hypothetical protein
MPSNPPCGWKSCQARLLQVLAAEQAAVCMVLALRVHCLSLPHGSHPCQPTLSCACQARSLAMQCDGVTVCRQQHAGNGSLPPTLWAYCCRIAGLLCTRQQQREVWRSWDSCWAQGLLSTPLTMCATLFELEAVSCGILLLDRGKGRHALQLSLKDGADVQGAGPCVLRCQVFWALSG